MKSEEGNEVGMHTYVFIRSRIVALLDFVKTKLGHDGHKIRDVEG